jgi:hypothetical protein
MDDSVPDRLVLSAPIAVDPAEKIRELRAELESAIERHAYHLETTERLAQLTDLVREWQEARKPVGLSAPGVGVAETYQKAVKRMTAVDEALAAYDLNGPAGGALVGQTAPTESTGVSLRDELAEIIRWRFKSADGKPLDGAGTLKHAQEIADAIVPVIEEAVGER